MEQETIALLQGIQSPHAGTRTQAEANLKHLYPDTNFPIGLLAIATHAQVAEYLRQAALLTLERYVNATWSPKSGEEFKGQVFLDENQKVQIRQQVLNICTSDSQNVHDERKIKNAATKVINKIVSIDFPEAWPDLLPHLLHIISGTAGDNQVHEALRLLSEIVGDGLSDAHFFDVARDLINGLQTVAFNESRKPVTRAMAMKVFRGCFDTLEMVMESHKDAIKGFVTDALNTWLQFFIQTIKLPLPEPAVQDNKIAHDLLSQFRGTIALKTQVIQALTKIRDIFASVVAPHAILVFDALWADLTAAEAVYHQLFKDSDHDSHKADADDLPYTLDWLVMDELDLLRIMLRSPQVKTELRSQLQQAPANGAQNVAWLQKLTKLLVSYAQITYEQEGFWDEINLFLQDETYEQSTYTPRTACADMAIALSEWLKQVPLDALLSYCQECGLFRVENTEWKAKEAALFILSQLLQDVHSTDKTVSEGTRGEWTQYFNQCFDNENSLLRARALLAAAALVRVAGAGFEENAVMLMKFTINRLSSDEFEVVQISCIRAFQAYFQALPPTITKQLQAPAIAAITGFVSSYDLEDPDEQTQFITTVMESLRDAIMVDSSIVLSGEAIDLVFKLGSEGAKIYEVAELTKETFQSIVSSIAMMGHGPYVQLCAKVLPSLTGAFDVADMREESELTNLAANLVQALVEHGSDPLPDGFVVAVMPKLNRVLMEGTNYDLVPPATTAVQYMLAHGASQFLAWQDATGKSAVEVTLTIIGRLLDSPDVDENAASEVGGLASVLVEKAGGEKLGQYLPQLLQAVAARLATAQKAHFIQSLLMVFVDLSLHSAREVVDFLAQTVIHGQSGLAVVLPMWLENSVNFAGFEEIRKNVRALSYIYDLKDPRVDQLGVKGELIEQYTGRIKTRSQARLNPDTYTSIPANLKILKILTEEISSAAAAYDDAAAVAGGLEVDGSDDDDDDDWEDDDRGGIEALDLGSGMTKEKLMAYADEDSPASSRARDDATAEYLVSWFRQQELKPGFAAMYHALNEEEREKLQKIVGQPGT